MKKVYITPASDIIYIEAESQLLNFSTDLSDDPAENPANIRLFDDSDDDSDD